MHTATNSYVDMARLYMCVQPKKNDILACLHEKNSTGSQWWMLDCGDVSECVSGRETGVDVDGVCSHAARGGPCIALTLFFLLTQLWQKLDWKELDNLPEIWQGCHRISQHPLHNYSIISDPRDRMKCACEQGYPPFQQFLSRHKLRTGWKKPSQYLSMRK